MIPIKEFLACHFSVTRLIAVALWFMPTLALAVNLDGVSGFGMDTSGGVGGKVLKVTSLDSSGQGSLRRALEQKGRRVIVFEVGGVIDLAGENLTVHQPYLTLAGETAPAPGITLIRGASRFVPTTCELLICESGRAMTIGLSARVGIPMASVRLVPRPATFI